MRLLPDLPESVGCFLIDVGGVLIKTAWELLMEAYPIGEIDDHLLGPFSDGTDTDWLSWQHGLLSEHDYWERWSVRVRQSRPILGGESDPTRYLYRSASKPVRNEVIRDCAGYGGVPRIIAVSNGVGRRIGLDWFAAQADLSVTESLIDADRAKARKPTPEFFDFCVRELLVQRDQLAFLDDNIAYSQAAAEQGILSYWLSLGPELSCQIVD
jgi:FMN phosphatase YigB (HAD superfamily)